MKAENIDMVTAKMRIDYRGTLLSIPEGEARGLKVTGKAYSGYTVAASRLRAEGYKLKLESIGHDTLLVTRG